MEEEVDPIATCNAIDEFNMLVGYSQPEQLLSLQPRPQPQLLPINVLPNSLPAAIQENLWEWNSLPEARRDYSASDFK